VRKGTGAQVHTNKQSAEVKRSSRGMRLRDDLVRKYRILAVHEGRTLYEVIEEALEAHLVTREQPH